MVIFKHWHWHKHWYWYRPTAGGGEDGSVPVEERRTEQTGMEEQRREWVSEWVISSSINLLFCT